MAEETLKRRCAREDSPTDLLPERQLYAAVLNRALMDAGVNIGGGDVGTRIAKHDPALRDQAIAWIMGHDTGGLREPALTSAVCFAVLDIDPELARRELRNKIPESGSLTLNEREVTVLRMRNEGATLRQIAASLQRSSNYTAQVVTRLKSYGILSREDTFAYDGRSRGWSEERRERHAALIREAKRKHVAD